MIYFNINISNPYWWNRWASIKSWTGDTPWRHKHWEIQIMRVSNLFRIVFSWIVREDHAGANLELALFGYQIDLRFYDSRHWNTETNTWELTDAIIK